MGAMPKILGMSMLLAAASCAPGPDTNDPPQSHVGTCTHFQNDVRQVENVPNCEMRIQHTMINGLQPVNPGNKS